MRPADFRMYLFGGLVDLAVGKSRVFLNVENLGDVRQTREHPLVRPERAVDGRWTVDTWAPLDGRTFNAGVRIRFERLEVDVPGGSMPSVYCCSSLEWSRPASQRRR